METSPMANHQTSSDFQPTTWSVGAKGGLYTGMVLMIFSLVTNLLEIVDQNILGNIFLFFSFCIGIYLTHKAFKDQGNGFLSFGQGLGLGTVVGLVSGVLTALFTVIYILFIDDSLIKKQLDVVRNRFEEQGLTDAQIDQAMYISEMMVNPLAIFFLTILSHVFYAFVVALIISAFTKKTDPELEF